MKQAFPAFLLLLASPVFVLAAADAGHATIAQMQEDALGSVEKEVVSLAEAMPADKYSFAPTAGAFTGVRTFAQQMSHIAAVLHEFAAVMMGEKAPDTGENENGPASLTSKDQIVQYLKEGFAHVHKANQALTATSFTEVLTLSWGKMPRGALAAMCVSHSFDHYGQAVVYARMNGIVPPASRH